LANPSIGQQFDRRPSLVEANLASPVSSRDINVTAGALVAKSEFSVNLSDWMRVAHNCLYRAKAAGRDAGTQEANSAATSP